MFEVAKEDISFESPFAIKFSQKEYNIYDKFEASIICLLIIKRFFSNISY